MSSNEQGTRGVKAHCIGFLFFGELFRFISVRLTLYSPQFPRVCGLGFVSYRYGDDKKTARLRHKGFPICCRKSIRVPSPVIQRHARVAVQVRRTISPTMIRVKEKPHSCASCEAPSSQLPAKKHNYTVLVRRGMFRFSIYLSILARNAIACQIPQNTSRPMFHF